MMYGPTAFSKNGQPTIVSRSGLPWAVNRTGLSAGDIATLELTNAGDHPRWISSVARDPGKLEVFVARGGKMFGGPLGGDPNDGAIRSASWSQPSNIGFFSPWNSVATGKTQWGGPVDAISRGTGLIDAFTVGTNGIIHRASWDQNRDAPGAFRGWWQIPGIDAFVGTPVVPVSRAIGKLDIFTVGYDGRIYTAGWDQAAHGDAGFGAWRSINGGVSASGGQLAVVSRGPNSLDAFTFGTDGQVYQAS